MQRFFNLINPLFLRSMLCGLRLRHVIKAGASRPSLVSHPPERRFPHGREFNSNFFFWFSCFAKIVEHGDVSFQLVTGRVWRGSAFGGVKGRTELPGIVEGENLLRSLDAKSRV